MSPFRKRSKQSLLWLAMMGAAWTVLSSQMAAEPPAETVKLPAERIIVDGSRVLNDTRDRQTGINMDYLLDDDRNPLLSPKRPLDEVMRELGAKYLRYPGGWKSAINLWSVPPYTSSRPKLIQAIDPSWLPANTVLSEPEGGWKIDPYDFDEFLETCRAAAAQPCVVVPYESMHWPAKNGWTPPSRELLLEASAAWVRYANKVKRAGVKYWEIGNETWLNDPKVANGIPAARYAQDLPEFYRRMKAEDPTILIGANGDTDIWWRDVLTTAADSMDFLAVHSYPCYGWTGYENYLKTEPDILGMVRIAREALRKYAPAHQNRLKICLSEFAAGAFTPWDRNGDDLGRALITFNLQGQLLESPEVVYSQFWNTHNVYENQGAFDALGRDNSLTAVGQSLWVWNHFLLDEMLEVGGSGRVRGFATRSPGKELNVFLVNKGVAARPVELTLKNFSSSMSGGELWSLHGTGPAEQNPRWEKGGKANFRRKALRLRLEPVSLTMLKLKLEAER